jgi:hypothetical protein
MENLLNDSTFNRIKQVLSEMTKFTTEQAERKFQEQENISRKVRLTYLAMKAAS